MLGLYDFHARYYNPMFGRWFKPDPALQTTNPYLYCGNSPVMYVDPDGEFFFSALIPGLGVFFRCCMLGSSHRRGIVHIRCCHESVIGAVGMAGLTGSVAALTVDSYVKGLTYGAKVMSSDIVHFEKRFINTMMMRICGY